MRHHLTVGIVRRLARTPAHDAFVLRGGLLTALWIAPIPRPTRDLDFVGDFPFDVEVTRSYFAPALGLDLEDGVRIDPASLRVSPMWLETAFPGVRLVFRLGLGAIDQELSVDVGFNDPLVPEAVVRDFAGDPFRVIRPETQIAWKLHALAEMTTSWRPKDLADVALILRHVPVDDAALAPAIVAAFRSREFSRASAVELFDAAHWATKTSRLRWDKPNLAETVAEVRARLLPILTELPRW